jgi:hypothetical protein
MTRVHLAAVLMTRVHLAAVLMTRVPLTRMPIIKEDKMKKDSKGAF